MSYLETLWDGLKSSVGKNRDNDPNDILKVEKSLKNVGYFDAEHSHGFITKALHDGIEKFQRDQNLKSDGFILPGGETERSLNKKARQRKPVTPERFKHSFSLKEAPVVNLEKDRVRSILNNTPAKFEIKENQKLKTPTSKETFIQNTIKQDWVGNKFVKTYEKDIDEITTKHGMDSDLVKAVMWTENARGDSGGINRLVDFIGISKTQAPMNINGKTWGQLINKKGARLDNEKDNIEASTILLKRIRDRIENPTPDKIGSIYNFTGREHTNEIGA
jgi:hypothetical protein